MTSHHESSNEHGSQAESWADDTKDFLPSKQK